MNKLNTLVMSEYKEGMFPNYSPANFIPIRGLGSRVWDVNGKEYIDLGGGIAVNSLGHAHPELVEALHEQSSLLWHTSNYLVNKPTIELANTLVELTFADNAFFSNSGSEANEVAVKLARKYQHSIGEKRNKIVSFTNSFHGRSLLNIALGGSNKHREGFSPIPEGIVCVEFNNLEEAKNSIDKETTAVIIEPIQGESGIKLADQEFLKGLKELCNQQGALLIFDEIQSGVGRTGHLFAYMKYGIEPDILSSAKGLGGGIPIGATITKAHIAKCLEPGSHGSTFGGNPIACAVAQRVINLIRQPSLLAGVLEKEEILVQGLENLSNKHNCFTNIRSAGLWIGCDLTRIDSANNLLDACYQEGLIAVTAGPSTLRLAPALNISTSDIHEGLSRLDKALSNY